MSTQKKPRHYKTITEDERHTLEALLNKRISISEIARIMNRPRRSIQREIKRGLVDAVLDEDEQIMHIVYSAVVAKQTRDANFSRCGAKPKFDAEDAKVYAKLIHEKKWSPAAVIAHTTQNNLVKLSISESTLYNQVAKGLIPNTSNVHLPRKGLNYRRSQKQYSKPKPACFGESIENRPAEISSREVFGHWEAGVIRSEKGKLPVILTLVERKTRFLIALRMPDTAASSLGAAFDFIEKSLKESTYKIIKSITFYNGFALTDYRVQNFENSCLYQDKKRWKTYYCHPYTSCERGSNENVKALLRRAGIPKDCDISKLSPKKIDSCIQWVNELPREILGFKTTKEAFENELLKLFQE